MQVFIGNSIKNHYQGHRSLNNKNPIKQDTTDTEFVNGVAQLTIQDLVMGDNLLYTYATTNGKYKYYIANSSETVRAIDGSGNQLSVRDPDEWMLTKMREAISRVDSELGLSFEEVSDRSKANLVINVRTELNSDYGTTVNDGSVADFLLKTADDIIFELNITVPYDYSGSEPTIITNPTDSDKQIFTNRFIHELGHIMGLEHPWTKDDNDWATETSSDAHTSSRMGYNEQLDSQYTWYSDTDIAALESLWGKDGEDSPILYINPYTEEENQSKANEVFLGSNTNTSISFDFDQPVRESDGSWSEDSYFYYYTEGIFFIKHPTIGEDIIVNYSTVEFTDSTASIDIPSDTSQYVDRDGNTVSLMLGSFKTKLESKYSLAENPDDSKNILKPFNETSKSGTLNFSSGDNIIIADGQAKTLRGLDGNDTYFVSNLLPKDSTIEIIDTSGTNTVQIAANTKVVKTLWTKDAARLTFEDDRVITINGADKFNFNMGGNVTDGTEGTDLTFAEFALSFGIDDVLNLSGSDTGTVTDLYII